MPALQPLFTSSPLLLPVEEALVGALIVAVVLRRYLRRLIILTLVVAMLCAALWVIARSSRSQPDCYQRALLAS